MMLAASASVAETKPNDVTVVVFSITEKLVSDPSKLGSWSLTSSTVMLNVADQKIRNQHKNQLNYAILQMLFSRPH